MDKQKQLEMCEELEIADCKGNTRCVFQTVRSLTQKFQPRMNCIQTASGENITNAERIAERLAEYCEDLYNDNDTGEIDNQFEHEPLPLRSEVARAIGETAKGKIECKAR